MPQHRPFAKIAFSADNAFGDPADSQPAAPKLTMTVCAGDAIGSAS